MTGLEKVCGVVDWGVVPYARACAWQAELVARRRAGEIPDLLVFCQHPHVMTLGRNARRENLLLSAEELARRGVEVHPTNRGGDVTYHGPGQLVGYPILDLAGWRKDVVGYVRALEDVLIGTAREFGVDAARRTPPDGSTRPLYTGVWVGEEKLAAIGVHIARWVTSHGFALNVATDLRYFELIVPCGISDKRVTSLARCLGSADPNADELMAATKAAVVRQFGEVFGRAMRAVEAEEWEAWVGAQPATAS